MAVMLITGLPGHGKSYYATLQILEELRRSERYIVTNVPLDLKELGAFCEQYWPEGAEPQLRSRVRLLDTNEAAEFYLYDCEGEITQAKEICAGTGHAWTKDGKPPKAIKVPDFSPRQREEYPGCLYVIDEAHLYFDAHAWQSLGDAISYFISQHRKLRADVLFITQHPAKLAKRLRLDLEEYTVVKNLGKIKGWKGVTLPGWFMRETWPGSPDDDQKGVEPEKGRFRLKAETIGKLYSTAGGVGLAGRVDTKEKKKGKHWSRWVYAVGIGGLIAILLPFFGLQGLGAAVRHGLGNYFGGTEPTMPSQPGAAPTSTAPVVRQDTSTNKELNILTSNIRLTGCSPWAVMLDDGRTLTKSEGWRWVKIPEGVYIYGLGPIPWKQAQAPTPPERPMRIGGFL